MVVGSGSLEDGGFDIVVAPENRRHDNSQRCFAVGTRTRIKGLSWNGYGDEYNIYSTTTTKVKVIMKKCKKVMNINVNETETKMRVEEEARMKL